MCDVSRTQLYVQWTICGNQDIVPVTSSALLLTFTMATGCDEVSYCWLCACQLHWF